jgi:hypothetical protein
MDSLGMGLGAARDDASPRAPGDFKTRRGLRARSQKIKLLSGGRDGSRVRRLAASWLALTVLTRRATSIFKIARAHTEADRFLEAALGPTDFQNGARFGSVVTNFPPPAPPPGDSRVSQGRRALGSTTTRGHACLPRGCLRARRVRVCPCLRAESGGGRREGGERDGRDKLVPHERRACTLSE